VIGGGEIIVCRPYRRVSKLSIIVSEDKLVRFCNFCNSLNAALEILNTCRSFVTNLPPLRISFSNAFDFAVVPAVSLRANFCNFDPADFDRPSETVRPALKRASLFLFSALRLFRLRVAAAFFPAFERMGSIFLVLRPEFPPISRNGSSREHSIQHVTTSDSRIDH